MPVNLKTDCSQLAVIEGVKLSAVAAGIKDWHRNDMVLIELIEGSTVAAVFTQNAFCAAPVIVGREHLGNNIRALIINAGNANAGTGDQGLADARRSCEWVAEALSIQASQVLPFSTGVISEPLPMAPIQHGINLASKNLHADAWFDAAKGIMTTDIEPKAYSVTRKLGDQNISITGISKGSGMIHPNMATMLAYIATDAEIDQPLLQACLADVVDDSFNAVTVDGDTSTNDACVLMATGTSGLSLDQSSPYWSEFYAMLLDVAQWLAKALARDGEGATKFLSINVKGGAKKAECQAVAKSIAHSPLVKTAFYASDPNLGRLLMAIGNADVSHLDPNGVSIALDDLAVLDCGGPSPDYSEEQAQKIMDQSEISLNIDLGRGNFEATVWTCDFSHDYVKINAEYRT